MCNGTAGTHRRGSWSRRYCRSGGTCIAWAVGAADKAMAAVAAVAVLCLAGRLPAGGRGDIGLTIGVGGVCGLLLELACDGRGKAGRVVTSGNFRRTISR
jgi:hypothetical protein